MSYDLNFWKYKSNTYLDNQKVYEQCSDGKIVKGLEDLPIEEIKSELSKEFSAWVEESKEFMAKEHLNYL